VVNRQPTVFIAAIGSDIGRELAFRYRDRGSRVIGTFRSPEHVEALRGVDGIDLVSCDVADSGSVIRAAEAITALDKPWNLFIGAVGRLEPIGSFFACDFDEWSASVTANSLGQLRLLHAIYPHRDREQTPSQVAFFVGGGINGPFRHYSAYCLGKVLLVKFCELIDDEYPDVHAVALGTGWVNTKIHRQTLAAQGRAGDNLRRTVAFVSAGGTGTPIDDILGCLDWCFGAERAATGGRNFSIVHDAWRDGGEALLQTLARDSRMFKLRRDGA